MVDPIDKAQIRQVIYISEEDDDNCNGGSSDEEHKHQQHESIPSSLGMSSLKGDEMDEEMNRNRL